MDIVKILRVLARTAPDDTCSAPDGDMPPVARGRSGGEKAHDVHFHTLAWEAVLWNTGERGGEGICRSAKKMHWALS